MSANWLGHHHGQPDSVVHRLPAALKLGVALVIIVATVLTPIQWRAWFIGVAVLLVLMAGLSRLPLFFLFRRLLLLSPFVLGVVLVNAFQPAGRDRWLAVAIKSVLCLLTVILISNTTPFSQILRVLKSSRVPGLAHHHACAHASLPFRVDGRIRADAPRAGGPHVHARTVVPLAHTRHGGRAVVHPRFGTRRAHLRCHVRARLEMNTEATQCRCGLESRLQAVRDPTFHWPPEGGTPNHQNRSPENRVTTP